MAPSEPVDRTVDRTAALDLVVVGAGSGMGYWLASRVFARVPWSDVTLIDVPARRSDLDELAGQFASPARPAHEPVVGERPALVVLAVPFDQLAATARSLAETDLRASTIAVVSDRLVDSLALVRAVPGDSVVPVIGVHCLFERSAASLDGQTVYLVPDGGAESLLAELVVASGGVVESGHAARHDAIMKYVQAAAHQTLLNFADILTRSGLDLERDLWAARTPLFEALFGLTARVLDDRQRIAIERIQLTEDARDVARELLASAESTTASIVDSDTVGQRIAEIGDHFSGTLFDTAKRAAAVAVDAVQGTRAELARHRAAGDVVGVRLDRRPDVLHVGRIVDIGPAEVVVDDVLLAGNGHGAALAAGPGRANAKKIGVNGKPRRVSLNLGHVALVAGAELDRELDRRLAFIRRDVRFLVPESVSGLGVLSALRGVPGTRDHELLSEVVRTGQRSVVLRVAIRVDRDLDDMVERLRALVDEIYAWPNGLCRPASAQISRIAYLGPPGTFSQTAARHCAIAAQIQAELVPEPSFDAVLDAVATGDALAVLPISSSSSGLVTRSFDALWHSVPGVEVGGIVDVSIRFDSYIPVASSMAELRGARLYSHPQALAQCRTFTRRWQLQPVECDSTAVALRVAAESAEPAVALAAAGAEVAGLSLKVGEREVDDLSGSITRFAIVGAPGAFGEFSDDFVPTMRTVWLGRGTAPLPDLPGYQELLQDAAGNQLVITSATDAAGYEGLRRLGAAPWSPRTPVVRVG